MTPPGQSEGHPLSGPPGDVQDALDLVLVAPGRQSVLLRTEFPRTIKLHPADARELARRLERCAEVLEQ